MAMDGEDREMSQSAIKNRLAVQAGNDVKDNVFVTMVTNNLDNISDFDGALQLTTDALKTASTRYDKQILKTAAWEALFRLSFLALVALSLIIAIGQMSTKPILISPVLVILLGFLVVSSVCPLRRANRIEARIKRELDAHSDVLSMLYREKILAKIKSLK